MRPLTTRRLTTKMPSREWVDLDRQVNRQLLRISSATERRILREYAVALKEVRNEMGRLYTKLKNPDGLLTLTEMTRYNRLNSLDKQIAGIMDSHYKIVVKELRRIPPEMYNESFFRYAWAFDQNSGVNLTWGTIPPEVLEEVSGLCTALEIAPTNEPCNTSGPGPMTEVAQRTELCDASG